MLTKPNILSVLHYLAGGSNLSSNGAVYWVWKHYDKSSFFCYVLQFMKTLRNNLENVHGYNKKRQLMVSFWIPCELFFPILPFKLIDWLFNHACTCVRRESVSTIARSIIKSMFFRLSINILYFCKISSRKEGKCITLLTCNFNFNFKFVQRKLNL